MTKDIVQGSKDLQLLPDGSVGVGRLGVTIVEFFGFISSTGVVSGGDVSINADSDLFDISAGFAIFVDGFSDPTQPPVLAKRTWPDLIGIAIDNPTTQPSTFISLDLASTPVNVELTVNEVIQRAATASTSQVRTSIQVGTATHIGGVPIQFVTQNTQALKNPAYIINDLMDALGPAVLNEGMVFSANGANLNVNVSASKTFRVDTNADNDLQDNNTTTLSAFTAKSFIPTHSDGSGGWTALAFTTTVDTANYDDGTGTLAAIPAEKPWAIGRFYMFGNSPGTAIYHYPQETFRRLKDALVFYENLAFDVNPVLKPANLRCHLIFKKDTTDLSDVTEVIFKETKLMGISTKTISGVDNPTFKGPKIVTVTTTPFTATDEDILLIDPGAVGGGPADIDIEFPPAADRYDANTETCQPLVIRNIHDSNAERVDLAPDGSEELDEVSAVQLKRGESVIWATDGSDWWSVG